MTYLTMEFTGERVIPGKTSARILNDHLERYNFAAKYVKDKRVLDISCGVGYGSKILKQGGARYVEGVDICSKTIAYARSNFAGDSIRFVEGDILNYFNPRPFDIITCFETIEHVAFYDIAVKNLYNLMRGDGNLLISSPNRILTSPSALCLTDKPTNKFHTQEFTVEELKFILCNNGFTSIDTFGQRLYNPYELSELNIGSRDNMKYVKSPTVQPIENLVPRYFMLIAGKQKA